MQFHFIDYSSTYFQSIRKLSTPLQRGGKFVQITNFIDQREYLVLSPLEFTTFHANIVARFCISNKIDGKYNGKKDFFYVNDPEWIVDGGGMFEIDDAIKTIKLYGESAAYGPFDAVGLEDKIKASGHLPGYNIIVK
jgi:hypothetical protein